MRKWQYRGERGSSSIDFVGVLPVLILVALISLQLVVAGFTLWSAAVAARAGARAAEVGTDAKAAALRSLPGPLRSDAEVDRRAGLVSAKVPIPRLLPLLPVVRVEARTSLGVRRG